MSFCSWSVASVRLSGMSKTIPMDLRSQTTLPSLTVSGSHSAPSCNRDATSSPGKLRMSHRISLDIIYTGIVSLDKMSPDEKRIRRDKLPRYESHRVQYFKLPALLIVIFLLSPTFSRKHPWSVDRCVLLHEFVKRGNQTHGSWS